MVSLSLGALGGPVWRADRATGRLTMSPIPIIVLLCGVAAPLLLARLDRPTPPPFEHSSFDRRYFWAEPASDAAAIPPLLAAAQIKRVAAARNVPYFTVRQLVDASTLDKNRVDITALNQALDRQDQIK